MATADQISKVKNVFVKKGMILSNSKALAALKKAFEGKEIDKKPVTISSHLKAQINSLGKDDDEKMANVIENFVTNKKVEPFIRSPNDKAEYILAMENLERKFKRILGITKGPASAGGGGGGDMASIQEPVGIQIVPPVSSPVNPQLVKADNQQAKIEPVAGESNAALDQRLNKGSTTNPSDNAGPDASTNVQRNAVQFTQYNGNILVTNPDLLGKSEKEQNEGLNSASVGQPQNAVVRQFGQSAQQTESSEPEFEKHARNNQPVKIGNRIVRGYRGADEIDAETEAEFVMPASSQADSEFLWSDSGQGRVRSSDSGQGRVRSSNSESEEEQKHQDPQGRPLPVGPRPPMLKGAKPYLKVPGVDDSESDFAKLRPIFRKAAQPARPLKAGGKGVAAPPQPQGPPVTRSAYTPEQLAILRAQVEDRKLAELEQANADREGNRQIGVRENTGLSTRYSRAGADIIVKPQDEIQQSVKAFANLSWINEGARNNSVLTKNSSLQKLWDGYDEQRYTDTYNPKIAMQYDSCKLFEDHRDAIKAFTDNRLIPQTDTFQEMDANSIGQNIQFGKRPAMSRPPTLYDVGDYTYSHNGVVGTQNLGLQPQQMIGNRYDYDCDTLHYPNIIVERQTDVKKYI